MRGVLGTNSIPLGYCITIIQQHQPRMILNYPAHALTKYPAYGCVFVTSGVHSVSILHTCWCQHRPACCTVGNPMSTFLSQCNKRHWLNSVKTNSRQQGSLLLQFWEWLNKPFKCVGFVGTNTPDLTNQELDDLLISCVSVWMSVDVLNWGVQFTNIEKSQ